MTGNLHPRFMGWVHGGGNPVGMLAEILAAGLNANFGGRDHAPIEVESQVVRWAAEMLGFPPEASGVLVTGTSIANLIGVLVARSACLGPGVRRSGGRQRAGRLHLGRRACCLPRAMEMAGLGRGALRMIPCDDQGRIRLQDLARRIERDMDEGLRPFLVVGTAGTVDIGAIDDLNAMADLAVRHGLWFHVDGAFGAIARCPRVLRPLLAGIERADSVASISTNGRRCRKTRAVSWCATPRGRSRRSAPKPPICGGSSEGWPAATSGPAIWVRTCPAASAR